MKKRLLSVILVLCMVLTLLPTTVQAETTDYGIWVGTTQVTSDNAGNVLGDSGTSVTYDLLTNTLTLDNATITSVCPPGTEAGQNGDTLNCAGIFRNSGDLKIVLVGTNSINLSSVTGQSRAHGIYALAGNVSITSAGSGILSVVSAPNTGNSFGITGNRVAISDCTVSTTGGNSTGGMANDISAGILSWGTGTDDNIVITNATVTAMGSTTLGISAGMVSNKSIIITDSTVTANGGSTSSTSSGLFASSATLTNSTLTATGDTWALFLNSLTATGHVVTASTDKSGADAASPGGNVYGTSNNTYKYVKIDHPATYAVTVSVNKNDTEWTDHGKTFKLVSGSTDYTDLTAIPNGTYAVYEGSTNTGVNVIVDGSAASVTLDYYTVTLTNGAGITATSGGGTYLKGGSPAIAATVSGGYNWSKWTQTNGGAEVSASNSYTISNISAAQAYTATAVSSAPITIETGGSYNQTNNTIGTGTVKSGATLQAALTGTSGVKNLKITAGTVTADDWVYIKNLTELERFEIADGVTVVNIPDATTKSPTFPRKIISVNIPQAIDIGKGAFYYCTTLTTVSLPKATTIGEEAFYYCTTLTAVSLPKATTIGMSAFMNCTTLTTVSLPKVTTIDTYGFYKCSSLTSPIDLPELTTIGVLAFNECTSLTTVSLPKVTTIGDQAFLNCKALTEISLPKTTEIGERAFYYCNKLTTVSLPELTTIGKWAFGYCTSLPTVSLPEATEIGNYAFDNCTKLTTVSLPEAMTIGDYAFYSCTSLPTVSLPEATSIGYSAFNTCKSLTTVSLPEATTIGDWAFEQCISLTTMNLPKATSIGEWAFEQCDSLTTVSLPETTSIGGAAFQSCDSLTTVSLPKATSIGDAAFYRCSKLTTVSLPKVTSIGEEAFARCPALTTLKLGATPPTLGTDVFFNVAQTNPLVLLDVSGDPLTGSTLASALATYKAVNDGNSYDRKWYGWTLPDPPATPTIVSIPAQSAVMTGANLNTSLTAPAITENGFTVIAKGWQISANGSTGWTDIPVSSDSTCTASVNGYYLRYYVTYSDSDNKTIYSPNTVRLTVNRYTPTIVLTVTPASPQSAGTAITLTATLSGGSSEMSNQSYLNTVPVTFKDGTSTLGTATITAGTSKATYHVTPASGSHTFTAVFPGETAYNTAATSSAVNYTVTAGSNNSNIEAAKTAAQGTSYANMTQAEATNEDAIEAALKSTAETVIGNGEIAVTINKTGYTPPVAGTAANPGGTNGSYTFTITVTKDGQSATTEQKTIIITATPYMGMTDAEAVEAAKTALVDGAVDVAVGASQDDKTAAVQSYVNGLLTGDAAGVTAIVTYNDVTGEYEVTLSRNGTTDSKSLSMTVTESSDPDIATVSAAKTDAQNAGYADMNQETAAGEDAIKAALESTAQTAVNNGEITVTINKVGYTAPIAGTAVNPGGTNGSYTFTITVSKDGQSATTMPITIIIAATPYTIPYDGVPVPGNGTSPSDTVHETPIKVEGNRPKDLVISVESKKEIVEVAFDGKALEASAYEIKDGQLVIKKDAFSGLKEGDYTLVVTYLEKASETFTIKVISAGETDAITNVPVFYMVKNMSKGNSFTLRITGIQKLADVTYESSNEAVVSITSSGKIKAKKDGTATVTATITQNGSEYKVKIKIKVQKGMPFNRTISKDDAITVNTGLPVLNIYKRIAVGNKTDLAIKNIAKDAVVTYSSDNTAVAAVSKSGVIKGKGSGECVVTAKIKQNGKTYCYKILVRVPKTK